jgi:hypothetical protein
MPDRCSSQMLERGSSHYRFRFLCQLRLLIRHLDHFLGLQCKQNQNSQTQKNKTKQNNSSDDCVSNNDNNISMSAANEITCFEMNKVV